LTVDRGRADEIVEDTLIRFDVVAESLDVKETSVGGEAYLSEFRKVVEPSSNSKIPGVINRRLGP